MFNLHGMVSCFSFQIQDGKGPPHMMDFRALDGSIFKIAANGEQDLSKSLGVEMVQNMYKVSW